MDTAVQMANANMTAGDTTHYTVPAATKCVLRHLRLVNPSASARTISVKLGGIEWFGVSLAAGTIYDWSGFYVMDAAETLVSNQGAGTDCRIFASGVEVA